MQTINKSPILVVDDEDDIREILQFNLENEGFTVDLAASAEEALNILSSNHQLIILDVMMPKMSGFQMANLLRKEGNTIPIIFLTAKSTENDMLTGFSIGADDYVSKPFSIKEIIARVKSVLKRISLTSQTDQGDGKQDIEVDAGLKIDLTAKVVLIDDEPINLTKTEFNILLLLTEHVGRVFSREEILSKVWKDDGYILERTVDVHIARLRKKIGRYGNDIVNRVGHGYVFQLEKS